MRREPLSRRDVLFKCAALGTLVAAPSLSVAESIAGWEAQQAGAKNVTAWNEIGPFYKRLAPAE
jgi:hypothetical protein